MLPDNIFLWPVRVVFPMRWEASQWHGMGRKKRKKKKWGIVLDNLALLYDALQLLHYKRADPH